MEEKSCEPTAGPVNEEELNYLNLIRKIMDTGTHKEDRTGTGTTNLFGDILRFDLSGGKIPLLTTKKMYWRGIVEELLWFIRGDTNANHLTEKGVNIWKANGSKEFLEKRGLGHREEGDLGPVYGFQWRHFGAKYIDMSTDYTGQGIDQLVNCINTIKNNPNDRRIIMSAWNPCDLELMALPPCHMSCQFFVAEGKLSCAMYQRSCDLGLGVPFNIASYSLLTCMLAHVCNLQPGEFVHMMGDLHLYDSHVDLIKEHLLQRTPSAFPTLKINPLKTNIDSFVYEDFVLEGYKCQPAIPLKMAV